MWFLYLLANVEEVSSNEATAVLRSLIVGLGGFCAGVAMVKGIWRLTPWIQPKKRLVRETPNFFFGILLLAFAGLSLLTTDHIYQHLIEDDAPLWQLWLALVSFTMGAVSLVGIFVTRPERRR